MDKGRPWSSLGQINDDNILNTGMELLGLLAQRHASGEGVGLREEMLVLAEAGHLAIRGEGKGRPQGDLFVAGVMLTQRIFGHQMPHGIAPHRLISYINALVPPLPPCVPYLLEELSTPDQMLRPSDAMVAYRAWAAAAAHEDLRYHAPVRYSGSWNVTGDTHVGRAKMADNQTNQDAMFYATNDRAALVAVADGISESDVGTGDMASRLFVETVKSWWKDGSFKIGTGGGQEFLVEMMRQANQAISERSAALAGGSLIGRTPGGTTAVAALCRGDQVELACIGDSRAYLVTPCGTGLLTADQNARLQSLLSGTVVDEKVADALIGYLGHVDASGAPVLLPVWYRRLRVLPGEILVLCSDGLHDYAGLNHLKFLRKLGKYAETMTLPDIAQALIADANAAGGGDNATVVLAQLQQV